MPSIVETIAVGQEVIICPAARVKNTALLLVECTNVLRRLELRRILTTSEASAAQEDLLLLNVQLLPFYPLADRVWELRHNFSSYDATYVAAAEVIDAQLATLDLKMASQPTKCKFLTP